MSERTSVIVDVVIVTGGAVVTVRALARLLEGVNRRRRFTPRPSSSSSSSSTERHHP